MAQLRGQPQRKPMNWMLTNENTWTNHKGCKVILKDDVVICVSTLENRIMHNIAVDALDRQHDIYVRNCRTVPSAPKHRLQAKIYRYLSSVMSRTTFNIFGLDLETTALLEFHRFNYRRALANNQYKLQVPRFVVESVKYIEKHGLTTNGIFLRGGNSFRPYEIAYQILRGDGFNVCIGTDVLEVAAVLKYYLENMPEGIFTDALEYQFVNAIGFDVQNRVKILNWLLLVLPKENREALYLLIGLFHRITRKLGSGIESRLLNDVFSPILFRYRSIVDNNCMGVIQVLIESFPVIFTLKARQLDDIYREMSAKYPTKLDKHLHRRTHQCHCYMSDIPLALRILRKQVRSYNACETGSYHHLKFKPRCSSSMNSHINDTTSCLLLMQQTMMPEEPYAEVYEATDDINQFPGFEMVETGNILPAPARTESKHTSDDGSSDCKLRINVLGPVAEVEEENDMPYDPGMTIHAKGNKGSVPQYRDVSVVQVLDGTEDLTCKPQYQDVSVVQVLDGTKDDGTYVTCKPGKKGLQTSLEGEDNPTYESYDPGMVVRSIHTCSDNNTTQMSAARTDTQAEKTEGTSKILALYMTVVGLRH